MSKKLVIAGSTLLLLAGIYAGATYYTSVKIKQELPRIIEDANTKLKQSNIDAMLVVSDMKSGFFNTTAVLEVMSNKVPLMGFNVTANHGPIPGFSSFGLGTFEATLIDDKGIREQFSASGTPISITANGRISFSGGMEIGIATTGLDTALPNELTAKTGNISIALSYKKESYLTWNIATPNITIHHAENVTQPMFQINELNITGERRDNSTGLSDVIYHTSFGKIRMEPSILTKFEFEANNLTTTATLTSKDGLAEAIYQVDASGFSTEKIQMDKFEFLASVAKVPVASALNLGSEAAIYMLPVAFYNGILVQNKDFLASNPTFTLSKLNMSNPKGTLTTQSEWEFMPVDTTKQAGSAVFSGLPIARAKVDVKVDRAFLDQFISEVMQVVLQADASTVQPLVDESINHFVDAAKEGGDLLAINEKQILFNLNIEGENATLNQTPFTQERKDALLRLLLTSTNL